jgi:hypothetical protein
MLTISSVHAVIVKLHVGRIFISPFHVLKESERSISGFHSLIVSAMAISRKLLDGPAISLRLAERIRNEEDYDVANAMHGSGWTMLPVRRER